MKEKGISIWRVSLKVAIVFPYKDEVNYKSYRNALDKALNDSNVQQLKIIVTLPDSVKKEDLQPHKLIHYISSKDIGFFGKVKDPSLDELLLTSYDLLLWLESDDKKIAKIISPILANWKVGVNVPFDFFSIKVDSPSEVPSELVNFAKNILEKISSYE